MARILEFINISKRFSHKVHDVKAVDQVNFSIEAGTCFGLVGESGSGKSTVAHLAVNLLKPDEGEIVFLGRRVSALSEKEKYALYGKMQMVFQNPVNCFNPRMKIVHCIMEGLIYRVKMDRKSAYRKALEAMEMAGLDPRYANRRCGQLSGGECQRAAIARSIIIQPELLICDEITSALDVSIQAQILKLLLELQRELRLSCLFISHDLALVSQMCEHIAVMRDGKIVESGHVDETIKQPKHPYTKMLLDSAMSL
jgi:ABC-type oligopeptide transport system ATPase subunit